MLNCLQLRIKGVGNFNETGSCAIFYFLKCNSSMTLTWYNFNLTLCGYILRRSLSRESHLLVKASEKNMQDLLI